MSAEPCPDPEAWVAWIETGPDPALRAHLAVCAACRAVLCALAETRPQEVPASVRQSWESLVPRRRLLPYGLAAAALLAVSVLAFHPPPPPLALPPARPAKGQPVSTEWFLGASGKVELAPGSRGTLRDGFRLESGEAWVEACGEPVRIRIAGWEGWLDLAEGEAALKAFPPGKTSAWIQEAWAGEGWGVQVVRGEALVSDGRVLKAGESLGASFTPSDFRGWKALKDEAALRDSVLPLLPSGTPLPFTAEMLVRKKQASAEAAVRFSGWEAPLGGYLPSGQWVRIRIEVGDKVRVLVGDREYFSAPLAQLGEKAYAVPASEALALRAWGGDVEVREARWRP